MLLVKMIKWADNPLPILVIKAPQILFVGAFLLNNLLHSPISLTPSFYDPEKNWSIIPLTLPS